MRVPMVFRVAALTGAVVGGALTWTVVRVQSRAAGDIEHYLSLRQPRTSPVVVAGASIVRGRASVDFVQMLRERQPNELFVNAGVNGNVAWEVLQRTDEIVACAPSRVVLLVGTNDVQATLSAKAGRSAQRSKSLPQPPSIDWYTECLSSVVTRLTASGCAVGVCSLPPIGQDLAAPVNVRLREFNTAIGTVCQSTGAAYLPVYEALADVLTSRGLEGGPAWTGSWWPGLSSLVRHFITGTSYDVIAASRGWLLSPDGVHMDTFGAQVIATVVEKWLVSDYRIGA